MLELVDLQLLDVLDLPADRVADVPAPALVLVHDLLDVLALVRAVALLSLAQPLHRPQVLGLPGLLQAAGTLNCLRKSIFLARRARLLCAFSFSCALRRASCSASASHSALSFLRASSKVLRRSL